MGIDYSRPGRDSPSAQPATPTFAAPPTAAPSFGAPPAAAPQFGGPPAAALAPVTGPDPVSIKGALPSKWGGFIFLSVAAGAALLILLISLGSGAGGGIFIGAFGLIIFGLPFLISLFSMLSVNGSTYITAGPDGIVTKMFTLRWNQIQAYGFVEQTTRYNLTNPHLTTATRQRMCSIVITGTETDSSGRPLQYGYTLPYNHTANFDEFRAAVRAYAPKVQESTTIGAGHYRVDPQVTDRLRAELARNGYIDISRKTGRNALAISPTGITVGNDSLPWSDVAGLSAVTDVYTSSTAGIPTSDRTHRLVVVTKYVDQRSGNRKVLRPAYPASYQPTIEQIAPLLAELVPHFVDQRTR